ncbi:DUF2523 domain-containing protein [Photobacterium sp. J15]|uniref:DUF2523 domain-containing protein n=1 Tax=Photobacterium sp. J15 TaxID=265901 RepID=UPI0007E36AFC|nr:DUF2523 domain-containing protein [Photobacterium sp. J15]
MARVLSFLFLTVIPVMPQLISAIASRVAISLGFGTVAYSGMSVIFDKLIAEISSSTSGLPANVVSMIALVGVPDAMNIMFSAGFTLLVFKGMSRMGNFRRMVWRKPGDKDPIDWSA